MQTKEPDSKSLTIDDVEVTFQYPDGYMAGFVWVKIGEMIYTATFWSKADAEKSVINWAKLGATIR